MKTTFVKIFFTVVLLGSLSVITSCSQIYVSEENSPALAWQEFCACLSDSDYKSAFEMTGNTIDVSSSDFDQEIDGIMLSTIAKSFKVCNSYKLKVNGVHASQSFGVTHIDMKLLLNKVLSGIMEETCEYEWKHGSYKTEEDISNAVRESLLTQMNGDFEDCVVFEKINVEFRYKDGKWMPVMNDSLYRAITGNVSDATGIVDSFFEEYQSKKDKS